MRPDHTDGDCSPGSRVEPAGRPHPRRVRRAADRREPARHPDLARGLPARAGAGRGRRAARRHHHALLHTEDVDEAIRRLGNDEQARNASRSSSSRCRGPTPTWRYEHGAAIRRDRDEGSGRRAALLRPPTVRSRRRAGRRLAGASCASPPPATPTTWADRSRRSNPSSCAAASTTRVGGLAWSRRGARWCARGAHRGRRD